MTDIGLVDQQMLHEHKRGNGLLVQNIQGEADQLLAIKFREEGHGPDEVAAFAADLGASRGGGVLTDYGGLLDPLSLFKRPQRSQRTYRLASGFRERA